ncbi:MAG: hypothetical protein KF841_10365 [Phycisphaerae bacterium]|nr:hypothetical protein [Phycisphaerae bacterium]
MYDGKLGILRVNRKRSAVWLMLATLLFVLASASDAWACAVCQGDADSDLTRGAKAGVILMVAVTYVLLLGGGALIVSWIVRARRMGTSL